MTDAAQFNALSEGLLPSLLGVQVSDVGEREVRATIDLKPFHMAPNGFLHAATVLGLADTACGYGCTANLPEGAESFTTVELKSNHLGTARQGTITCVATAEHMGRTTQVWDAIVSHEQTGKTIALFRCTQMILYPRKR